MDAVLRIFIKITLTRRDSLRFTVDFITKNSDSKFSYLLKLSQERRRTTILIALERWAAYANL